MSKKVWWFAIVSITIELSGCSSLPTGPSVLALPGSNKSSEQFRNDENYCRQFALSQLNGINPNDIARNNAAERAIFATLIGAAIGAALNGGEGAAFGAGLGLLEGTIAGLGIPDSSYDDVQVYYDTAYLQCMYAYGHQVPVSGNFSSQGAKPIPPKAVIPQPPPGQCC